MKKIFLAVALATGIIACSSEPGTGDGKQENTSTLDENVPTGSGAVSTEDTTSTTNNNAYNKDSAAGKGGIFDTSSKGGANKQ